MSRSVWQLREAIEASLYPVGKTPLPPELYGDPIDRVREAVHATRLVARDLSPLARTNLAIRLYHEGRR